MYIQEQQTANCTVCWQTKPTNSLIVDALLDDNDDDGGGVEAHKHNDIYHQQENRIHINQAYIGRYTLTERRNISIE